MTANICRVFRLFPPLCISCSSQSCSSYFFFSISTDLLFNRFHFNFNRRGFSSSVYLSFLSTMLFFLVFISISFFLFLILVGGFPIAADRHLFSSSPLNYFSSSAVFFICCFRLFFPFPFFVPCPCVPPILFFGLSLSSLSSVASVLTYFLSAFCFLS